ncbi:MAG TPA: bifunctional serine/threonine-protein kinase/formylglycine-generating enzyme family protein [Planctomycetota bacterium]|nr:bifunctional serine/threonine-protein kinase/formylglycine-generating enzyme family protein [Planctomycetota bacterium]
MGLDIAPGYEIVREIGKGGMGTVYAARAKDGRSVAIKVLVRPQAPGAAERFERERRLLDGFTVRDGFVPLLDAGRGPLGPFLVMPFMEGGTLRDRIEKGPLPIDEALALGRALARALGHAHGRGIVHRDMKPENVLYSASGEPLVTDLGLAKHFLADAPGASQSVRLSKTGELRGTAGYMAPEQMADARSAGPPADVYALGAVLYEALAGKPAFHGVSVIELLDNVSAGRFEPLRDVRPEVPRALAAVVERALALDPAARFADAGALLRALDDVRTRRGSPWLLVLVALLVLAALGAVLGLRKDVPSPPPPPPPPVATPKEPALPRGLRLANRNVPAADGKTVPLYLYALPDGKDMEMVSVAKGDFIMGADGPESIGYERPSHTRSIDRAYWIGRNDVTWAQYLAYCRAVRRSEPEKPWFWGHIQGPKDDHPVVEVSWDDARAYCTWARLELPTAAEWERAARGTDGRRYPWGNEWDPATQCNYADASCPMADFDIDGRQAAEWIKETPGDRWDTDHNDGYPFTSPVGSFPAGVSPVGALDMAGNVYQWCEDPFADNHDLAREGVFARPDCHVFYGGSWVDPARRCRSSYHYFDVPTSHSVGVGFRVVLR